ncbi:predicted protein [Theileria equi strain WA]|uniref:Uncharacterized protein n=1 Tax=Theileria equi strain WA TaxID=1537102 RepID=L1LCN7_THEEQ|nr:predicted protein [Theileria equi strain WA]EKX73044.1 predicted protein [Theileria equi strain WA]|eukprot:XP_004832496.1 predicted protein [Theileria equi strain WA]
MSRGIRLDIGPTKRNGIQDGNIKAFESGSFSGYAKYIYKRSVSGAFELSGFNYNEKDLSNIVITSAITATAVTTYFDTGNQKLFIIHADTTAKHIYYTNYDISKDIIKDSWFEEFITINSGALTENSDIKSILENIEKNTRLYYYSLSSSIKKKLLRGTDIAFDITKKPETSSYKSELTDVVISPKKSDTKITGYNKVQHSIGTEPFFARQIKLSGNSYMDLGDTVPNVPVREFNVYYSTSDGNYGNPLLVLLNIKQLEDVSQSQYIPNKYLLSKNGNDTDWDIRRIVGSIEDTDEELGKVLKNISEQKRLEINQLESDLKNKLTDISKDLIINLTGQFSVDEKSVGSYDSESKTVYYKRFTDHGYTRIKHCYTFFSFTVKEIKFDDNHSIDSKFLPQKETKVYSLSSYHHTISDGNPLLVYLYDEDNYWLKRQRGDTTWQSLYGDAPTKENDPSIKPLLETLSTPKVAIDISQYAIESYNPTGNILYFKVESTDNPAGSDFWKFKHTGPENKPFTIKRVYHGTTQLKGIDYPDKLLSISGFFSGKSSSNIPLLVELVASGSSKYSYFHRVQKDGTNWTELTRSDGETTRLESEDLKKELERLKKIHFPDPAGLSEGAKAGIGAGSTVGGGSAIGFGFWKGPVVLRSIMSCLITRI